MSGLSAAQAALNTVSNNISSYNVAGYTRQTTVLGASNSTLTGGGWVGNGVYVSGVQREYDAFITNQLRAAQTDSSGLTTRYQQMSKIDDVLSDTTNSLSATLQGFFTSLQTLVSNAEDPAARQTVLGKADGLVNQFKVTDQYLRDQEKQINTAITTSVDQINGYAKQIANLNDQISRLTGVGAGASPNNLLDQRDQLVSELNQIVGVEVSVQDSGRGQAQGLPVVCHLCAVAGGVTQRRGDGLCSDSAHGDYAGHGTPHAVPPGPLTGTVERASLSVR
jgi:flagellar hook-associated protein 1 FlgK